MLPTYQSIQVDINVGSRDIGLRKYSDSFRSIEQPAPNIQADKF